MLSHFIDDLGAAVGKALGLTHINNHDATVQPSNPHSLSHSYARDTTPPSPPSRTFVDLSSPIKTASPSKRQQEAVRSRPRPTPARRSKDELRLIGDFSTPADAVACPDPQSWNLNSHMAHTAVVKKKNKPGARDAFKPVDTLTEGRTDARKHRVITYSRQNRPSPQTIGKVQYAGQRAYLESEASRNGITSARAHGPQAQYTEGARGPSPAKRRRTQHVIEIDGDDEPQHVPRCQTPLTPATASHGMRTAGSRSQSQVSVGNGTGFTTFRPPSQTESEFRAIDRRLTQHRKSLRPTRAKRHSSHRAMSVEDGGVSSLSRDAPQPAHVVSDVEQMPMTRASLDEWKQGIEGPSQEQAVVTSKYFPNAQINESTVELEEASTGTRSGRLESTYLRDKYRPPPRTTEDIDDSPDELAMSPVQMRNAKSKAVPSKAVQAAHTGVQRKKPVNANSELSWHLNYARSHDFACHGPGLRLNQETDVNYGIQHVDADHTYQRVGSLDLQRVSKIDVDDVSRIRLTGSRHSDGTIYTVDLEFAETEEFVHFRDRYAVPHSGLTKAYVHDKTHMQSLLQKILPQNITVGQKSNISTVQHGGTSLPVKRHSLPSEKNTMYNHHLQAQAFGDTDAPIRRPAASLGADKTLSRSTRTSVRAKQSTTASSVLFDVPIDHEEVEKYSQRHGLGPAWKRPLMYGQGKQRATVHFEDLPRLDEEEFLNDSLIDFYMIYLFKQHKVPSEKVYFFNTYFYTALTTDTGRKSMNYAKVARWTQKIDIFGYDYIVVPINELTHWYLAIICNVSSIDRSPVIEDFDDNPQTTVGTMQNSDSRDVSLQDVHIAEDASSKSFDSFALSTEAATTGPVSRKEGDVNLFEENSQLNLVDPHDLGPGTGNPTENRGSTIRSRHEAVGEEAANFDGFIPSMETKADLEKISGSQKSKKPKKRQYVLPKKDPEQPIIIILDSLRETRSSAVRALKDWILAEGQARRGMQAIIKENGYYAKATQIPTQSNWSDCGVYLLGYVDKFFQDPDDFKIKLLTGGMFAEKDWPEFHPKQMRNHMREVIFACMKDQEAARGREKRAKLATADMDTLPASTNKQDLQHREPKQPPPLTADDGSQRIVAVGEVQTRASEPATLKTPVKMLESPCKAKPTSAEKSDEILPEKPPSNRSHIPLALVSPAKSAASTLYTKERYRHRSPEVRISSKSPGKPQAAQTKGLAPAQPSADESQQSHQQLDLDVSAPRRRPNDSKSESTRFESVQRRGTSPQAQSTGRSAQLSPSTRSNREGSTPNTLIEIAESQDPAPEPIASPEWMPKTFVDKKQLVGECPPSSHFLRAVPSLEEIDPSSFHASNGRRLRHDKNVSAKSDLETRGEIELRRAQSPMLMDPSLQRTEERLLDRMEIDSPTADTMDIDTLSRRSEVEKTPEPEVDQRSSTDREPTPLLM